MVRKVRAQQRSLPIQRIPFFALPAEIRNRIYRRLLLSGEPPYTFIDAEPASILKRYLHPAILRTNRQAHTEASSILYGENTFNIGVHGDKRSIAVMGRTYDAYLTDQVLGRPGTLHIRKVTVEVNLKNKPDISRSQRTLTILCRRLSDLPHLESVRIGVWTHGAELGVRYHHIPSCYLPVLERFAVLRHVLRHVPRVELLDCSQVWGQGLLVAMICAVPVTDLSQMYGELKSAVTPCKDVRKLLRVAYRAMDSYDLRSFLEVMLDIADLDGHEKVREFAKATLRSSEPSRVPAWLSV